MGDKIEYNGEVLGKIHPKVHSNKRIETIVVTEDLVSLRKLMNIPPVDLVSINGKEMTAYEFRKKYLENNKIYSSHDAYLKNESSDEKSELFIPVLYKE